MFNRKNSLASVYKNWLEWRIKSVVLDRKKL